MSDKELAVQLYTARLQAHAILASSPNYDGSSISLPSNEQMVNDVESIARYLSEKCIL